MSPVTQSARNGAPGLETNVAGRLRNPLNLVPTRSYWGSTVFQHLMTKTYLRRIALFAATLPVLFIAIQSASSKAQAATPFDRPAMWIWYVDDSNNGNLRSIIRQARQAKIGTVFIKSGDGDDTWSQFNKPMVRRLQNAGLKVCGWQYTYGSRPLAVILALTARFLQSRFTACAPAGYALPHA